jgi:hypothetical protein
VAGIETRLNRKTNWAALCVLAAALAAPAALAVPSAQAGEEDGFSWPYFYPDDPLTRDADDMPIDEPRYRSTSQYYDFIENMFLGVGRDGRRAAMNTNTLGEVPNSSWFENRHGHRAMTVHEVVAGPLKGPGPDMENPWTITKAKSEGVTPGFTVKDSKGTTYFVKVDPVCCPGMLTSTEAICTPFFHAMGYNVPENYLVDVNVENIVVGPGTEIKVRGGVERKMKEKDLHAVLRLAPVREDNTLRVIASKAISGVGLFDHFRYHGTRSDDPNDIIPHQHRRELRGLKVLCAWLNHDDSRSINTLDVFTKEGFVKHYLIDFGSCLGSSSIKPQTRRSGNEHIWEAGPTFKTVASLGLWVRPYLKIDYPDYPCIGRFESKSFRPELWKPEYPNPAFDNMDRNDAFWAARIMMRFSDEYIRAVVENGDLGDPDATEYMIETLIERRDKLGRYHMNRVNPLADFVVEDGALNFTNLSVRYGFGSNPRGYEVVWRGYDNQSQQPLDELGTVVAEAGAGGEGIARLPEAARSQTSVRYPEEAGVHSYIFAEITPKGEAPAEWRTPIRVFLRDKRPGWEIVGIYR